MTNIGKLVLVALTVILSLFIISRLLIYVKIYQGYRQDSRNHFEEKYYDVFVSSDYLGVLSQVVKEPHNRGKIVVDTFKGQDIFYLVDLEKTAAILDRSLEVGDTIKKKTSSETVLIKWSATDSMELKLPFYY
ncbi:MAG: hypothetical protein AAF828_09615 [Bacteroidota bacterium]